VERRNSWCPASAQNPTGARKPYKQAINSDRLWATGYRLSIAKQNSWTTSTLESTTYPSSEPLTRVQHSAQPQRNQILICQTPTPGVRKKAVFLPTTVFLFAGVGPGGGVVNPGPSRVRLHRNRLRVGLAVHCQPQCVFARRKRHRGPASGSRLARRCRLRSRRRRAEGGHLSRFLYADRRLEPQGNSGPPG
jgi:hypothetical protein